VTVPSMTDIRYLVVSDLHLGADNSVLTKLHPDTLVADPSCPSDVLVALVETLRTVVRANHGPPPTLVLLGDVIELALGAQSTSATVFSQFVSLLLTGDTPVCLPRMLYVPGNHDHHLWELAREQTYDAHLAALPADAPVPDARHTTPLFPTTDDDLAESTLLTTLARRASGRADARVVAAYPNVGLTAPDGDRTVLASHGHYLEPIARLPSTMRTLLFPGSAPPIDVERLEEENFAWVDFFWGTLGQSGQMGSDVGVIYDLMQRESALRALGRTVGGRLTGPRSNRDLLGWLRRAALQRALAAGALRLVKTERRSAEVSLSPKGLRGVENYVRGPVRYQLFDEGRRPGAHTTFLFGHTHKPFEMHLDTTAFPGGIDLVNTGGWVVEQVEPSAAHGAAVVVIDEHLELASLRMYDQVPPAGRPGVRVVPGGSRPAGLHTRIDALIDPAASPWSTFTTAVSEAIADRHTRLLRIIDGYERTSPGRRRYPR
jgi:UDP-2,3-diacylglucosamine pyrophosphatase LpxH